MMQILLLSAFISLSSYIRDQSDFPPIIEGIAPFAPSDQPGKIIPYQRLNSIPTYKSKDAPVILVSGIYSHKDKSFLYAKAKRLKNSAIPIGRGVDQDLNIQVADEKEKIILVETSLSRKRDIMIHDGSGSHHKVTLTDFVPIVTKLPFPYWYKGDKKDIIVLISDKEGRELNRVNIKWEESEKNKKSSPLEREENSA